MPRGFVQLRLIAQPVVPGVDLDFSRHLVFTLALGAAGGVRDTIVRDLLALEQTSLAAKFRTTGVPLGVQPALARGNVAFQNQFSQFLGKHLSPK